MLDVTTDGRTDCQSAARRRGDETRSTSQSRRMDEQHCSLSFLLAGAAQANHVVLTIDLGIRSSQRVGATGANAHQLLLARMRARTSRRSSRSLKSLKCRSCSVSSFPIVLTGSSIAAICISPHRSTFCKCPVFRHEGGGAASSLSARCNPRSLRFTSRIPIST